jgi:hypothetical protein
VRAFHFASRRSMPADSNWFLITVWGFLLFVFGLALKHHKNGRKEVWLAPVTTFDWFNRDSKKAGKLPTPVTARRARSQSQSKTPYTPAPKRHVSEKRSHAPPPRPARSRSQSRQPQPQMAYNPERRPQRNRSTDRYRPDYYRRDASPRR